MTSYADLVIRCGMYLITRCFEESDQNLDVRFVWKPMIGIFQDLTCLCKIVILFQIPCIQKEFIILENMIQDSSKHASIFVHLS